MILSNFFNNLTYNSFLMKDYLNLFIKDIKEDHYIFAKDTKKYIYKSVENNSMSLKTVEEQDELKKLLKKMINDIGENSGYNLLIKIDNYNKDLESIYTNKSNIELINKYLNAKEKQFENKKSITTYYIVDDKSNKENFKKYMQSLENKKLNKEEIKTFLFDYYNPEKRHNVTKRDGIENLELKDLEPHFVQRKKDVLNIGNLFYKFYHIIEVPKNTININDLISDLSKLKSNVMINVSVVKQNGLKGSLSIKETIAKSPLMTTINEDNEKIGRSIAELKHFIVENKDNFVNLNIKFALYSDNEEDLNEEINLEKWNDCKIFKYNYSLFDIYKGFLEPTKSTDYAIITAGTVAANLLYPETYEYSDLTSLFFNKFNGYFQYDFHSPKRIANGGLVIAPTGRGKSVLLNYIYLNYFIKYSKSAKFKNNLTEFTNNKEEITDFQSLLIDFGGSYNNLIRGINESLSQEDKIYYKRLQLTDNYNIFDLEFGYHIRKEEESYFSEQLILEKIDLLILFFETALEGLTDIDTAIIRTAALEMYNKYLKNPQYQKKNPNDRNYVYIEEYYKKELIEDFINAMPTYNDFIGSLNSSQNVVNSYGKEYISSLTQRLTAFIANFQNFSDKSSSLILANNVCIDFSEILKTNGRLSLLILMYFVNSKYGVFIKPQNKDKQKLFLVDEYPQFLETNKRVEKYIDLLLKTGRKNKIDTYVIVQNARTLNPDFFTNSGSLITFALSNAEIKDLTDMYKAVNNFFKPIEELKTIKGEFSEIMITEIGLEGDRKNNKNYLKLALNDYEKENIDFLIVNLL